LKKHFLFLIVSCVLTYSGSVTPSFAAGDDKEYHKYELTQEDRAALSDAGIAALKVGLKLTAAQEKNWPTLETALKDAAKARNARIDEWHKKAKENDDGAHFDVIEHLQEKAKYYTTKATELEKIAEAAKPLYNSLDDSQKHRLGILLHHVIKAHKSHGGWKHHNSSWR